MQDIYLHKQDAVLVRRMEGTLPEYVDLYDCDGDKLFTFPGSMSDAQIMVAIDFANKIFSTGVRIGAGQKLLQIRAALGIEA